MKLYVGNLFPTTTEADLFALCSPYGSIAKINIIRDHYTRQSKCFGYVQMTNRNEGCMALQNLHNTMVNDRRIVVKEARSRDERDGALW